MVHHSLAASTHTQYTCNRFEALAHRPPPMIHSSTDYLSNSCTFVRVERTGRGRGQGGGEDREGERTERGRGERREDKEGERTGRGRGNRGRKWKEPKKEEREEKNARS